VKEIDNNLELEAEGRVLMLPLMEKGKINLYGYRSMFVRLILEIISQLVPMEIMMTANYSTL